VQALRQHEELRAAESLATETKPVAPARKERGVAPQQHKRPGLVMVKPLVQIRPAAAAARSTPAAPNAVSHQGDQASKRPKLAAKEERDEEPQGLPGLLSGYGSDSD
jgi:hypothetical protein